MINSKLKKGLLSTASAFVMASSFSGAANAATLTVGATATLTATHTSIDINSDDTIAIADGLGLTKTPASIVTDSDTSQGTLNFAGSSTIAGTIGNSTANDQAVKVANLAGASGKTVALNGLSYIDLVNINGTGTLDLGASLYGAIDFNANGTVELADTFDISGAITTLAGGATGNLIIEGTSTLGSTTGATGSGLAAITTQGTAKTATFTGNVFSTLLSADGTGKVAFNGNATITTVAFGADGTIIMGDDDDLITTTISTDTTNTGTIQLAGTNAGLLSGNVGADGAVLKEIKFTGAHTRTTNGDLWVTTIDFNDTASTLVVVNGENISGNVIDSGQDEGTLTFSGATAADSTVTGSFGTSSTTGINILNHIAGTDGSVLTLNGADNYIVTTNIGAGQLALNGNLTGIVNFAAAADATGAITIADGKSITGAITAAQVGEGIVTYSGDSTQTGAVGASGNFELARINLGADGKTVSFTSTVDADAIVFSGDGTASFAGNVNSDTGVTTAITTATDGEGTVTFTAAATLGNANTAIAIGASGTELKKLNINTTGTVTVDGDIYTDGINFGADGTLALLDASDIENATAGGNDITTSTNNTGTLQLTTNGTTAVTIDGSIGASGAALKLLNLDQAAKLSVTGDIYATTITLDQATTELNIADGKSVTGDINPVTSGTDGILSISGSATFNGKIGTSALILENIDVDSTDASDIVSFTDDVYVDEFDATGSVATVKIAAGKKITDSDGISATEAGSVKYDVGITEDSDGTDSIGQLVSTAGAIDLTNASIYVRVSSSSDYIAAGNTYIIADSAAAATAPTAAVEDNSYSLSFTASISGNDIIVTAARQNTFQSSSTKSVNKAVGTALETIGTSGSSALDNLVGQLDSLETAAAVEAALETLTPEVNGQTTVAVANASSEALGTVSTRLSALRTGDMSGIATGSGYRDIGLWGQVFGSAADQGDREGVRGYQADTFGGSIGVDTEVMDDIRLGVAGTYSDTDVDSARGGADIQSFQGTVYGSYQQGKRWYDAMVGVAFNNIDTHRNVAVGNISDQAKGDSDGNTYTAKLTTGYDMKVQGPLQFTPRGSLQYTYIAQDDYTETGSTANLTVSPDENQAFIAGLGFDVAYPLTHNGVSYLPSLSFTYLYDMIGDEAETTSKFTSASTTFLSQGADVAQSTFEFGVGLDIMARDDLTVSLDYDLTEREDYSSHAGSLKARLAF